MQWSAELRDAAPSLLLSGSTRRSILGRMERKKITPDMLRARKGREPIAALTAYDFPMAKLLDDLEIPLILVGDSLGMVVLGYPDTTHVTLADMEHHVRAVARAKPAALLIADLPFHTYQTPDEAVVSARKLVAAGAEGVKAEGGRSIGPSIRAILDDGIRFVGHLGMLPQSVVVEGGYRVKGKRADEHEALLEDAHFLDETGATCIVLELVTPPVAGEITRSISIPTIGIGAGPDCDGQILVTTDLLGTSPGRIPKHVRRTVNPADVMREAIAGWRDEVTRAELSLSHNQPR